MTKNAVGSSAAQHPTGSETEPVAGTTSQQAGGPGHAPGQEPWRRAESGGSGSRFARVAEQRWGYDPGQVDDFLDRLGAVLDTAAADAGTAPGVTSREVRATVFDRTPGGYDPGAVDARLDQLEDELAGREREAFLRAQGDHSWEEYLESLGQTLLGRLNRPRGERFRKPSHRKQPGYSIADVDVLCERLVEHFRSDEALDPSLVRTAVFRQARGSRSYEEQQVDAFLDRVLELLLALR